MTYVDIGILKVQIKFSNWIIVQLKMVTLTLTLSPSLSSEKKLKK